MFGSHSKVYGCRKWYNDTVTVKCDECVQQECFWDDVKIDVAYEMCDECAKKYQSAREGWR